MPYRISIGTGTNSAEVKLDAIVYSPEGEQVKIVQKDARFEDKYFCELPDGSYRSYSKSVLSLTPTK